MLPTRPKPGRRRTPPTPRWRATDDARRTPDRPRPTHAPATPDARSKQLMRRTQQWPAARRKRRRLAARQARKSEQRPRATQTWQARGNGNAAWKTAASGRRASCDRSHRPIRPPHVANGACPARAIDTPAARMCPAPTPLCGGAVRNATRSVQWRLMSRQAFHSTCAHTNRQGRPRQFAAVLRFVTLCFNSLPLASPLHGTLLAAACCLQPETPELHSRAACGM